MPAEQKISIERGYRASVEGVSELWTTPEGVEAWWTPDGFTVEVSKLDLATRRGAALLDERVRPGARGRRRRRA